jgi:hypothetical protein
VKTVAEARDDNEPALVERWLQDQQHWQKTLLSYLDSMVKNEDFLVNIGNAMRGSLLAGKPYPTAPAPGTPVTEPAADARLDQLLFELHQIQGQLNDLSMTVAELRNGTAPSPAPQVRQSRRAGHAKRSVAPAAAVKNRKRKGRG